MKVETLMLCDSAQAVNGKLYVLGGAWNMYRAVSFPAPMQMALAIDVSFTRNEAGIKFPLSITISDEAGVAIIPPMNGQMEVGVPTQEVPKGAILKLPLAINTNLQVPRPGRYTISVNAGSSKVQTSFDAIFVGTKVELTAPPGTDTERGQ